MKNSKPMWWNWYTRCFEVAVANSYAGSSPAIGILIFFMYFNE